MPNSLSIANGTGTFLAYPSFEVGQLKFSHTKLKILIDRFQIKFELKFSVSFVNIPTDAISSLDLQSNRGESTFDVKILGSPEL